MAGLFDPLKIRGITFRNRIGLAPMCQSSATDGRVNDWHLVHLGSRAVGGAALVLTEAVAVESRGRIMSSDLGLWSDAQVAGFERITSFIRRAGAVPGIQLAHAGRKSSYGPAFNDAGMTPLRALPRDEGGWQPIGPTAQPFDASAAVPVAMGDADIRSVIASFAAATRRADAAGFDCVELHAAHGYLMHSFYSPVSNLRTDEYGGSFENRVRLVRETVRAMRDSLPTHKVLAVRLSHTDWLERGWSTEDTVALARLLRDDGADLIDVSSGGTSPTSTNLMRHMTADGLAARQAGRPQDVPPAVIPLGPGYQVPGASAVRRGAGISVAAVGMITDPLHADSIVRSGDADMILLGREMLRDPYWPLRAAEALGAAGTAEVPCQYYLGWSDRGAFRFRPFAKS